MHPVSPLSSRRRIKRCQLKRRRQELENLRCIRALPVVIFTFNPWTPL
jgi:hypothetical protein